MYINKIKEEDDKEEEEDNKEEIGGEDNKDISRERIIRRIVITHQTNY